MAMQQRNDVDYFPHPVSHSRKMHYVEKKYQNDGYATWFKILESLGETNFHFLDLNDEITTMFLEDKCHIPFDRILEILTDLVRMEEFDKDLFSVGIVYSDKFVTSIQDAYRKRVNKEPLRKEAIIRMIAEKGTDTTPIFRQPSGNLPPELPENTPTNQEIAAGNQQRKEKESKEEYSKEEENKNFASFSETYEEVVILGDDAEERSKLINEIIEWFGFTESYYHQQQIQIMHFVNKLFFDGVADHFKTQWAAYTEYKALSGSQAHQLPGFIEKWNQTNWVLSLEAHKNQKQQKSPDKSIAAQVERMNKVKNPFITKQHEGNSQQ